MTHLPPEWAPQERLWIGFPGDAPQWPAGLAQAQVQAAAFASAAATGDQAITLVTRNEADAQTARALAGAGVEVIVEHFGDIWFRDIGPIGLVDADGTRSLALFDFNGWGGKYQMAGDEDLGRRLAARTPFPIRHTPLVFEGGAVDTDGTGLFVTTEQCLLNPNRNPTLDRRKIETLLAGALGLSQMLWLGDGLINDHTDGHVDNLARFVAPGTIAIPVASTDDDPNGAIFTDAAERARAFGLEVAPMPSVGAFRIDGDLVPASYMNFCITNGVVVVPQFGAPNDAAALEALKPFFPGRAIVGVASNDILRGGGSFHCMSQQVPAAPKG